MSGHCRVAYRIQTTQHPSGWAWREGYAVSEWVVAERDDYPKVWRLSIMHDGRLFAFARTLREARAIGAKVDATKPTLKADGTLTQAAIKRIKPLAFKVRHVA